MNLTTVESGLLCITNDRKFVFFSPFSPSFFTARHLHHDDYIHAHTIMTANQARVLSSFFPARLSSSVFLNLFLLGVRSLSLHIYTTSHPRARACFIIDIYILPTFMPKLEHGAPALQNAIGSIDTDRSHDAHAPKFYPPNMLKFCFFGSPTGLVCVSTFLRFHVWLE